MDYWKARLSVCSFFYFFVLSVQGVGEEWHETKFQDETLSVIAATSDSGLGSHGTPSVIGEETISGQFILGIDWGLSKTTYIYIRTRLHAKVFNLQGHVRTTVNSI